MILLFIKYIYFNAIKKIKSNLNKNNKIIKKSEMGRGGYGKFPYLPRPTLFNFLNGTRMRIFFNKRDGVGRGGDPS